MKLYHPTEEELEQLVNDISSIPNKIKKKIEEKFNESYDLIIINKDTGYGTLILKPGQEVYKIIDFIYCEEKVTEFTDFKIKNNSYRVFINMSRGRISGQYKVENGKLVLISDKEIDPIILDKTEKKHRHHYVPRVYFKHFNNDKHFVCFKLDENKKFSANRENLCHEHNLHELSKYLATNYIENELSKIESSYKPFFDRLDSHIFNHTVDKKDTEELFNYVTLQFFRHPNQIQNIENILNSKEAFFKEAGRHMALINLISEDGTPQDLAEELLKTHDLEIYASSEFSFMTSDMPVTLMANGYIELVNPNNMKYGYLSAYDYWFVYDEHTLIILKYSPTRSEPRYYEQDEMLRKRFMISAAENGANYFFAKNFSDEEIEILRRFDKNNYENKVDVVDCYIEEYTTEKGLGARLRDKKTNKRVTFWGDWFNYRHLLRFLSQAKIHIDLMPTIYDKNGKDIVSVRGIIIDNNLDEIVVDINVESGGYLFDSSMKNS